MDIDNSAKSPLQEAFEIAAQIIAGENSALLERISQLEQQLESMNEKMLQLQDELLQLQQGMPLIPVVEEKVEADEAFDETIDVAELAEFAEETVDVSAADDDSDDDVVLEQDTIPDSMAGLGVLPFATELMEKANEAAAGSDVFELMERNAVGQEDDVPKIINEAARPDWFDWEVDYPASYVEDVYKAISFNDRYEFIKELFNISGDLGDAEVLFKDTLDEINEMENFKQVVAYIRERFPLWDEQSDEVYRFYMAIRRKFNKQ